MNETVFFDTNIIFYAYDSTDAKKQQVAQSLLVDAASARNGVISTQVLGEFFHAAVIRKRVMTVDEVERLLSSLTVYQHVEIDRTLVFSAIDIHRRFQLRYWDALIVAAAKQGGCNVLLTEDLSDSQDYGGVVARNPFTSQTSP